MCDQVGIEVHRLQRVGTGGLTLALAGVETVGSWRVLDERLVDLLTMKSGVGLDR
jgi:16S rRNA U516 pseudouridylate synthase RsuA-like enzyme